MARGKAVLFQRDQGGRERIEKLRARESLLQAPRLPKNPPAELAGMPAARAAWRGVIRAHGALPTQLLSELDRGFLVGYCLAVQGRADAAELARMVEKRYSAGELKLEDLIKVRVELRMSTRLVSDLEKQIYGTPKSRAGVTPPAPEPPEPERPLPAGGIRWDDYIESLETEERGENG